MRTTRADTPELDGECSMHTIRTPTAKRMHDRDSSFVKQRDPDGCATPSRPLETHTIVYDRDSSFMTQRDPDAPRHRDRASSFCASTAETVKTGSSKLAPLFTGSASGGTPRQNSVVICFLTYSLRSLAASPSDVASGSPRFEQTYGRRPRVAREPRGAGD